MDEETTIIYKLYKKEENKLNGKKALFEVLR